MTAKLYYNPFIPAFSNTGVAISGAKLYFFLTNTLTPAPAYTDATLTTPLSHPVVADGAGKYPDIYLDSTLTYRVRQTESSGAIIGDDIDPYIPGFVGADLARAYAISDTDTPIADAVSTSDRGAKFYADLAEADAALTALDRIATGADVTAAGAAKTLAEIAAASTGLGGSLYATTAAGLAAVAEGEYFFVENGTGNYVEYQDLSGVATATGLVIIGPTYLADSVAAIDADATTATTKAAEAAASVTDATNAATAVLADFDENLAKLTNTTKDLNSSETIAYTETVSTGRIHSPDNLLKFIATPIFEGADLTTPVVPVSIVLTGKNIVNPAPSLWESGQIDTSGVNTVSSSRLRTAGFIPVKPSTQYSRRGVTGVPIITLYDSSGTFVRQINITVGIPDTWITAANETQMRLYFVVSSAVPTHAFDAQIQVEQSAVPSTFEAYHSVTRIYDPVELYKSGSISDKVTGTTHTNAIERRTISGTGTFGIASAVSSGTNYYSGTLADQTGFLAQTKALLTGLSAAGDYVLNATSTTQARGIWASGTTACRVAIAKTAIDAMAGASILIKFQAYLDANPITAVFDRGSWAATDTVGAGVLVMPKGGSIVLTATGGTTHTIEYREVSASGGGGGSSATSIAALEAKDTALDAVDADLQSQIDVLTVDGDSSVEAAAARVSAIGYTDATLKARLDRMEKIPAVNVWNYIEAGGAYNASADHTAAVLAARTIAETFGMALDFRHPATRTINLSRGIRLHTSATVLGVHNVTLKKIAAVTSDVNGAVSIGDTVIPVDNAALFSSKVGCDVYVGTPSSASSYNGTRGTIVSVNTGANTVTIESYNRSGGTGLKVAWADGEAVLSTTFPIIYTDYVVSGTSVLLSPQCAGLKLDGNVQAGEPNSYPCSCFHFDQQHVVAPFTDNCIVINSPADALSDQSNGWGNHNAIRMYNNTWHGIHIGFTNSSSVVTNCYATGNGSDGMYFCYGNTNTRAYGNFFENMPYGFKEIGAQLDGDVILAGNITKNISTMDYEVSSLTEGAVEVSGILSIGGTGKLSGGDGVRRASFQGTDRGRSGVGFEWTRSSEITMDVKFHDFTGQYNVKIMNTAAVRSSDITVKGQLRGATVASVLIQSSDNCMINPDVSKPAGIAPDFIFATDGAQAAPTGSLVGVGLRKGTGITALGTNVDAMA